MTALQHETGEPWRHAHLFGQHRVRPGERRTVIVLAITALMMLVEIAAGVAFGSMALLADGLHMGSHAVALGIAVAAYVYARKHADDERFSFGTGKVNALAGFAGAVLLAVFALIMASESVERWIRPVPIAFDRAILVAFVGLVVNGASVLILGGEDPGHGEHEHEHEHENGAHGHHSHADHNLRSAYLHVLADALTSVLAIVALLSGKLLGAVWLDPFIGIVGAVLVARWSWELVRQSAAVLLDRQAPERVRADITRSIEGAGDERVTDLHVWVIAPGAYAAEIALVTREPRAPGYYKDLLPPELGLAHVTVEVHRA